MKHLSEYRDPGLAQLYLTKIHDTVTRPWNIMEVCGGQTHSLVKNGILGLLPNTINMVHGPGCPVCVTPLHMIDKAVELSLKPEVILCSFGDMLRVPGSKMSLLEAKARGADVRILYSPLEAVELAKKNPKREVIFFAVGFETTAPANALSVILANEQNVSNYSILNSHVLVPPAIEAVMQDPDTQIQGFLAAGHVCTIMGLKEYEPLSAKYNLPIVATGFEPVDLLQGIYMVLSQLEKGEHKVENQYARVIRPMGNKRATDTIEKVFRIDDREWRGIGTIPLSGYVIRDELSQFDAMKKFDITDYRVKECESCIAGLILKGLKKPHECSEFAKRCTPETPLGAPMVSSEGACAAYYHFSNAEQKEVKL